MKTLPELALLLAAASLCGCRSAPPNEDGGFLEPVDLRNARDKDAPYREAVRGLRFANERVSIDPEMAHELVPAADPRQAREELARGHELLRRNRRIEAIEAMTRAVLLAPELAAAYEGLGDALVNKRKYRQAGAAFRSALDREPTSASLHLKLADILIRANDRDGGIRELREAARFEPENGKVRERLAIQLYYTRQTEAAWAEVHAAEAAGHSVPPQFRLLLAARMPEPEPTDRQ